MLHVLASILLDHLVDGQIEARGPGSQLYNALCESAKVAFQAVFAADSPFWSHYHRLGQAHQAGLALEAEAQQDADLFSDQGLETITRGKVAPMVVTMAALSEASDQPALLAPIERSLGHCARAYQLLDDVKDWQEDLEARHLTYYLARLAPREAWNGADWPSVGEIQRRIDAGWVDVEHLRLVLQWLDDTIEAVEGIDCSGWIEYIAARRELADEQLTYAAARHLRDVIEGILDHG
jgi:hypothetical protein